MKDLRELNTKIGSRISSIRASKPLTQYELSKKTGINIKRVSRLESGQSQISVGEWFKISETLDITFESIKDLQ